MYVNLTALVLILVANTTPVLASWAFPRRTGVPIDANLRFPDGQPLLGSHKTWRGFIVGVLATGVTGVAVSLGFSVGAQFAALALSGDLLSSFVKRRLHRASGHWVPLLDQVPEALLPMLVLQHRLGLDAVSIIGTLVTFTLLDMISSKLFPTGDCQPKNTPTSRPAP